MTVDRALAVAVYRRLLLRRALVVAVAALCVAAAAAIDLVTGASNLPVSDLLQGIIDPASLDAVTRVIVWNVRLPYAVMAVMVGAALALAGAEMQTVLDNPLASPFTLGVSSAAAVGASLAISFNLVMPGLSANWIVSLMAFVFSFGSVLLLQAVSKLAAGGRETIILLGIALVFTCNAIVALLQLVAPEDVLQQLVFWTLGSIARADWEKVGLLALTLAVVTPFSIGSAWKLTVLRLGEDRAASSGVDVRRLRFLSLIRISLLASISVACVGPIGFVGLVGPHIARLCVGEDQRFLLPVSALIGALILSLASVTSKSIIPGVTIPVGIVTALVGVPLFVVLVLRRGRA
nr:iron ABC transporter permease [Rhizobium sp. 2MFCol3.1]